ncbi:MAG: GAF domain-containing protein, partial [Holophagales bacterium]|nr:GAF domain-containing protein [Holophagales bacterium]
MNNQITADNSQKSAGGEDVSVPLKKSLLFRLIVIAVLVTLALCIVVLCIVNYGFKQRIETEYINRAAAVSRTVACIINSELIDRYISTLEKDAEYGAMLRHLRTMQREHKLSYVFVTRMTEDGPTFIFDTNERKPLNLGDSLSWADAIGVSRGDYTNALCRGEHVEPLFSSGNLGRLLYVFEPIYREDGSVAGYAGVGISIDQIMSDRKSALVLFSIASLFIFIAIIATDSYVLQRHVISPIVTLVKNTEAFLTGENLNWHGSAAGDLDLQPKFRRADEFAVLERSIIAMKLRVIEEISERTRAEKERAKEIEGQLDTLKKIMNGMNLLVCVTVPETGELLFASEHILSQFGVTGDVTGKMCYEVLGGQTEMCDYCPYYQLEKEPKKVVIWEHKELNGKTYNKVGRLIDWPGGRKAHLEFGTDITNIVNARETILYKEKIISALNETAVLLLAQKEENFKDSMTDGIGFVVNVLNLDRVTVWRNVMEPDGLHGGQVFRWDRTDGGTTPTAEQFTDIKVSDWMPRWEKVLSAGEAINGPARLLPEAALLQSFGCISVFISPVITDGSFWGYVMFEDRTSERVFKDDEADILRSTSLMISSAVTRQEEAVKIREANERLTILLNATPFGCVLWNRDLKIIDCNETAVRLYGFRSKQELIENHISSWPEYQPDGRPSRETAFAMLRKCFDDGHIVSEWMYQTQDGTPVPMEIALARIKLKDGDAIVAYMHDLREHKRMMSEIEQQTKLLRTVNRVSAIILESRLESFKKDLTYSMEIMAGAVEADRVYIWKNCVKDGKLYCSQIYEWSGGAESQNDYALAVETLYGDIVPGWEERLSQGNCISGIVSEMSDYEKTALSPQGILSILIAPIFLRNQFWGFIGFDNCRSERVFSEKEEMLLRSASQIIANALIRNEET